LRNAEDGIPPASEKAALSIGYTTEKPPRKGDRYFRERDDSKPDLFDVNFGLG
jgi:hypothetical protein